MSMFETGRHDATGALHRRDLAADPVEQFARWFQEATEADLREPTAMTLATASPDGRPSARMVLLKGFDARGFRFFTNYASGKGRELAANPRAALVFWWDKLERQVRVSGTVAKVSPDESRAYHATRPRASQLGAYASDQSEVIDSRDQLEQHFAQVERDFAGRDIPLPENWGGYRLTPDMLEFWQGRPSRLHDRFRYTLGDDGRWALDRLSP